MFDMNLTSPELLVVVCRFDISAHPLCLVIPGLTKWMAMKSSQLILQRKFLHYKHVKNKRGCYIT